MNQQLFEPLQSVAIAKIVDNFCYELTPHTPIIALLISLKGGVTIVLCFQPIAQQYKLTTV